jgi:asparagine synthase (glutamine-hydrolysing)
MATSGRAGGDMGGNEGEGSWRLAWGSTDSIGEEPIWRDQHVALFAAMAQPRRPAPNGLPTADTSFGPYLSSSGQYVLVGDLAQEQPVASGEASTGDRCEKKRCSLERVVERWGSDGVATLRQLQGGYGLVIVDRWRNQLCLVRDPIGIKTLYLTRAGALRWIAPCLRSLAPYRSNALDTIALRDYLCCAFVPGERTLWSEVRELRPGTLHLLPQDRSEAFFDLKEQIIGADKPLEWHGGRLQHGLIKVVAEALPQGEASGVFLSGGLDSSCITAIASQLHREPLHTFSIHFGPKLPNELEFAQQVARHCRTQHHELEISMRDLWQGLPETMAALDDPIGDPLTVPNLLLGRMAKRFVNVILNGEGGDPCFGGPKNQPMLMHRLYQSLDNSSTLQAFLSSFQKCATDLSRLLNANLWKTVKDQPYVFSKDFAAETSYLNCLMALNIKFKGADHILTKVNNCTQAAGLQARSPLFDSRIVEMSMQIPPHYKLSGIEEKAVLKSAVASFLPRSIVERPKSGMMVPVQIGFRNHWNRQATRLLLNRKAAIAPLLERELIRDWLHYKGDAWNRYGVKLWLLCSLEYWLQANGL